MKTLIATLLLGSAALAAGQRNPALIDVQTGVSRPAPATLSLAEYQAWSAPLLRPGEAQSAFTPKVFEWYMNEKDRDLPREAYADPQKIYVNLQRPLEQTIELEDNGEITEGNTVGAEVYAVQKGTVKEALETMLFRWGKPTGAAEGRTYPPGGPYHRRVEYFAANPDWGPGAYANLTLRRDGGIVKDLADRYIVLVRGDETRGYDVLMNYLKDAADSETEKCIAIAIIRPLKDGNVSYKISTRYQGQSYKILGGVKIGREQIGFNEKKVRAVQVESNQLLQELQATGSIKDRRTDIEWGK